MTKGKAQNKVSGKQEPQQGPKLPLTQSKHSSNPNSPSTKDNNNNNNSHNHNHNDDNSGHGHSHGGAPCSHNHNAPNQANYDEEDYNHGPPTQIPYYIVILIIAFVWGGFILTTFVFEDRKHIILQGTSNAYPYILPNWLPLVNNPIVRTIYHFTPLSLHPFQWITFAFISFCFFLSFHRVTYTDPGSVDQFDPIWGFHKQPAQVQQQLHYQISQYHLPSILPQTIERKHNGARRYCRKTNVFKPDRSHYCYATSRLVKRLDHYCIFLSASVGYNNHKFFILFLFWLIMTGLFIGIKLTIPMDFVWRLTGLHMLFNLVIACFGAATSLALSAFLAFHLWLITNSLTTIESGEKYNVWDPMTGIFRKSPFNVNWYLNFSQVFGHGPIITWFLPVHPTRREDEDGTVFPIALPTFPGVVPIE